SPPCDIRRPPVPKQCSLVRIAVVRRRWSIPPSAPVVLSQPWPPSLRAHRAAVLPPRARRACPPPHPPASSAHHGGTSLDRAPGARSRPRVQRPGAFPVPPEL